MVCPDPYDLAASSRALEARRAGEEDPSETRLGWRALMTELSRNQRTEIVGLSLLGISDPAATFGGYRRKVPVLGRQTGVNGRNAYSAAIV